LSFPFRSRAILFQISLLFPIDIAPQEGWQRQWDSLKLIFTDLVSYAGHLIFAFEITDFPFLKQSAKHFFHNIEVGFGQDRKFFGHHRFEVVKYAHW